jgi:hypothetical protein
MGASVGRPRKDCENSGRGYEEKDRPAEKFKENNAFQEENEDGDEGIGQSPRGRPDVRALIQSIKSGRVNGLFKDRPVCVVDNIRKADRIMNTCLPRVPGKRKAEGPRSRLPAGRPSGADWPSSPSFSA